MSLRSLLPAIGGTAVLWMLLLPSGCHSKPKSAEVPTMTIMTVTGTVAYRLRIALPPDAEVHVRLEDVSRADEPAIVVAEKRIASEGQQVPIAFTLPYDASRIIASHTYVVRATISSGGRLLFTTTQAYPVLTNGAGHDVQILVEQVQARSGDDIENTKWRLVELNGEPSLPSDGRNQAGISFVSRDHTIAANTGVNGMGGEYAINGDALTIKPGMMTMMAGPPPMMRQEQVFIAALSSVTGYRLNGETLELLDNSHVLMRFVAVSDR